MQIIPGLPSVESQSYPGTAQHQLQASSMWLPSAALILSLLRLCAARSYNEDRYYDPYYQQQQQPKVEFNYGYDQNNRRDDYYQHTSLNGTFTVRDATFLNCVILAPKKQ